MGINLVCKTCKSNLSIRSKVCKNCGYDFINGRKYKVVIKGANGKRITKVVDTISVAKKLEQKLKTQTIENNLFGMTSLPMVDEVWDKYLFWAKQHKKSWNKDSQRWQKHVQPYIKGKKMDAVSAFNVQKVIDNMKAKREYAPATIKHVIVLIKRVYNWGIEMDLYHGENPANKIRVPILNNEITECLSKDEICRLLKTLDHWVNKRVALLTKFALYTGMRRGEVFNLTWENIDLENGWVCLSDTKGGRDSYLPISDEALQILKEAKNHLPHADCPYVFPNKFGYKRTTLSNTWTRIKKRAKIHHSFRFHGLRHTYASYLASSGKVSPYTLQKLRTHKTPQMTQRYAHIFDETLREGANVLHELF